MDPVSVTFAALASLVAAVAFLGLSRVLVEMSLRRRQDVAAELGLTLERDRMIGRIDGLPVTVRTERRGSKNQTTYTVVEVGLPGAPEDLAVVPSNERGARRDLPVGDPLFDMAYRVDASGPAWGWLSAEARETLHAHGLALRKGKVVSEQRGDVEVHRIRSTVAATKALEVPDPWASLGRMADADPSGRMRARAIGALAEGERAPRERLEAWSGQPGIAGLVARAVLGRPLGAELRGLDQAERYQLAEHLARCGPPSAIVELAKVTGPGTDRPVWFQLTEAAVRHSTPEVRVAVFRAAERLGEEAFFADRAALALIAGGRDAEELLEPLLPRLDQSLPAVFDWLRENGEVSAIPWLDRVLAASWPLSDTRERAREAKRAIQSRAAGEKGGLALAPEGREGALSEARVHAGRVGER